MRAFIALDVPDGFVGETAIAARQLSRAIEGRFMAADTYHITLAFLGEVDGAAISAVMDAMDDAIRGMGPLRLTCTGLGKFGRAENATLWLGVDGGDALTELANRVREGLDKTGVEYDRKPFKPHLTIARRARIPGGQLPPISFPAPSAADTVTLYESTLFHDGARYDDLYSARLEAAQER